MLGDPLLLRASAGKVPGKRSEDTDKTRSDCSPIVPVLAPRTIIAPRVWWFRSSSLASLIYIVQVVAVSPASITWPTQEKESMILGYGASWDCTACWLCISKSIIALTHMVQNPRVVTICFSSQKTRKKK